MLSGALYLIVARMWPQCARWSRDWKARSATPRPATALRLAVHTSSDADAHPNALMDMSLSFLIR